MDIVAAKSLQHGILLGGLDALGRRSQSLGLREFDDRAHDLFISTGFAEAVDEAFIDLNPIDVEALLSPKGGEARTEIVKGKADSDRAQRGYIRSQ